MREHLRSISYHLVMKILGTNAEADDFCRHDWAPSRTISYETRRDPCVMRWLWPSIILSQNGIDVSTETNDSNICFHIFNVPRVMIEYWRMSQLEASASANVPWLLHMWLPHNKHSAVNLSSSSRISFIIQCMTLMMAGSLTRYVGGTSERWSAVQIVRGRSSLSIFSLAKVRLFAEDKDSGARHCFNPRKVISYGSIMELPRCSGDSCSVRAVKEYSKTSPTHNSLCHHI